MTQQQLFANYELDDSRWRSIIIKFLGGSLVVHLILFLSAVYVPAVRDAFYVAMLFSDAGDKRTVNRDYTLDEIGDTATVIKMANPDRFRYPEGYFNTGEYVENPMTDPTVLAFNDPTLSATSTLPPIVDTAPPVTTFPQATITTPPITTIPPIVNTPPTARNRSRRNALPPLPKPNPNAKMDSLTPNIDETATPNKEQTANANKAAEAKPSPGKDAQLLSEDEINRKPLYDFAAEVNELQKNRKIDLNKPYAVTVEGELNKAGQLTKTNVTKKEGDPQLTELAKKLISVLNASGVLKTISNVVLKDSPRPVHKIKFDVLQDPNNLTVNVVLEFDNADEAYKIQSGANILIAATKLMRKDKVEGQILQNVAATTDGKLVVFKSVMPRAAAEKLIQDQLASAVQKQADQTKQ